MGKEHLASGSQAILVCSKGGCVSFLYHFQTGESPGDPGNEEFLKLSSIHLPFFPSCGFVLGALAIYVYVLVMGSALGAKEAFSLPFEVKPSPSKKFRSGSSFSRRAGPSSNSCVTYQPATSGERKAQVTTKAEVEPGQRQGWVRVLPGTSSLLLHPYGLQRASTPLPDRQKSSRYLFFPCFSFTCSFLFFID